MKLSQLSLADYNQLDSIPVINQDLSASGFTPVANTYYRHTGATTDTFTQGVIYLYDTAYHKLGESGGGTTLNRYAVSRPSIALIRKILLNAKGLITGRISLSINESGYMFINPSSIATSEKGALSINAVEYAKTTPNPTLYLVTGSIGATSTTFTETTNGVAINMGDFSISRITSLSYQSDPSIIIYYNDTEITV